MALGYTSRFIEPLKSTSIHLIRLLLAFPFEGVTDSIINEYNKKLDSELNSIRDSILLHYKMTECKDDPFANYYRAMEVLKPLSYKID